MPEDIEKTDPIDTSKPTFEERVINIITDWFKGAGFKARKLTDTPTDALQVVPKNYVDKGLGGVEYDMGNVSGTATVDWSNGHNQYMTLTGNVTLTFTNPKLGLHSFLHIAGAFTPTFPASVRWTGGTTPSATATAGHKDIYTLLYSTKEGLYDVLQSPNYAIT